MTILPRPGFLLGVLGGMGPLATADFMHKLIDGAHACSDDQHVPLIVASIPQIPPRVSAITGNGESPLPALREVRDRLLAAGATMLVMPCNTAHHWHAALAADVGVAFPHMADIAFDAARRRVGAGCALGLIATAGTLASGFYQQRADASGYRLLVHAAAEQDALVAPGIAAVKAGELVLAGQRFDAAIRALHDRGARAVILGCTEVPPGLAAIASAQLPTCIDATQALADASVQAFAVASRQNA